MKRAVHHSAVWLIAPLWFLFVGISLGRVALLIHYNHVFTTQARPVEGVVQKKFEQKLDRFSSEHVYALLFTYNAENVHGRVLTQVRKETFDRVKVGGPVPLLYMPGDARQHRINYPWEIADEDWAPLDDFVVAMMVFIPGVLLIAYFGWRNAIYARLQTRGTHTWGEVTGLQKTHTRQGSYTYLTFRFTTPEGREIEGRSATLPENSHWQTGDPIQVLFDPKRPERFAVDVVHPLDLLDDEPAPAPFFQTIFA